ncbi:MAG: hypothetical protein M3Q16_00735 [Pseudomonadota bacterium]|nr:hypothetical protein [Pseudomonadota bacterium]
MLAPISAGSYQQEIRNSRSRIFEFGKQIHEHGKTSYRYKRYLYPGAIPELIAAFYTQPPLAMGERLVEMRSRCSGLYYSQFEQTSNIFPELVFARKSLVELPVDGESCGRQDLAVGWLQILRILMWQGETYAYMSSRGCWMYGLSDSTDRNKIT